MIICIFSDIRYERKCFIRPYIGRKRMKKKAISILVLVFITGLHACTISLSRAKEGLAVAPLSTPERTPVYESGDWIIARASMHNHTVFSDGTLSMEGLVQLARNQGMAVLAISDHHKLGMKLGPIRAKDNSISEREGGYEDYFESLLEIRDETTDIIVIPGVEYTGWETAVGRFPNVDIWGGSHHFVIYGIEDPEVYARAPHLDETPIKEHFDPEAELDPLISLVSYFREEGGIVILAHPDWYNEGAYGPIKVKGHPYGRLVNQLKEINGFAAVPEGIFEATKPGLPWDHALLEYIIGERDVPIWAIGDADFHGEPHTLANGTTMLYLRELNTGQVYEAMEKGRMVLHMGDPFQDVFVKEFWVSSGGSPKDEIMLGENVKIKGRPRIHFALSEDIPLIRVLLIRNGVVIYETSDSGFDYVDELAFERGLPAYYRVEVKGERRSSKEPGPRESYLFTNPIFVEF